MYIFVNLHTLGWNFFISHSYYFKKGGKGDVVWGCVSVIIGIVSLYFNWINYLYLYYLSWFLSRAIRHPASGYVQGINDLATPFLVVFLSEYLEGGADNWSISDLSLENISNLEADCYWCLSKLLDGMQDHYTFAQPGIQRLVFKLKELVRRIDGNTLSRAPFFVWCNCFMPLYIYSRLGFFLCLCVVYSVEWT